VGEATSLGVAVKPVDALRIQHSYTARPGLRPRRRGPLTPTVPAVPLRWLKRLKTLDVLLHRCSQLHLSAMGRGLCFTAYGSSCIFYAAEFKGLPVDVAFQRALRRAMADLVNGRTQRRLPGVVHGSPREGGFGFMLVTEHVHACHAKWLCHATLSSLLKAVTADVARDPAKIILPDTTDLPGGVGPPRQRPDPMWRLLAANALQANANPPCPPYRPSSAPPTPRPQIGHLAGSPMWRARRTSCSAASCNSLRAQLGHWGGSSCARQPPTMPLPCSTGMQFAP
jgi:hypothetical protein